LALQAPPPGLVRDTHAAAVAAAAAFVDNDNDADAFSGESAYGVLQELAQMAPVDVTVPASCPTLGAGVVFPSLAAAVGPQGSRYVGETSRKQMISVHFNCLVLLYEEFSV